MQFWFADSKLPDAGVAVVGVPLDRTSSHIPGTRFGPDSARIGAENIESFSPYQLRDVAGIRVHDMGNLGFTFETPQAPFDMIAKTTRANHQAGRHQLAVGGEHTVTPAIVRELSRSVPELHVIQFDAHSDLRDEYLGEKWCHATAMARVLDSIPRERLFQVGIRSFENPGEMKLQNVFPFEVLAPIRRICEQVGSRPVYLTLDVDVLDPGVLPEVQTPQPGGCSYRELAQALAQLTGLKVVGGDIVEYCPKSGCPAAGASVVAELIRELILLLGKTDN